MLKMPFLAIVGLKAPELMAFLPKLYRSFRDTCQNDIFALVKECFTSACLSEGLNDTLIALVPKIDCPQAMSQLRPISLCNTLYKVISKISVADFQG